MPDLLVGCQKVCRPSLRPAIADTVYDMGTATREERLEEEFCFLYLARDDLIEARDAVATARKNQALAYFIIRDAITA